MAGNVSSGDGLAARLIDALSRNQDELYRVARVLHEEVGQVLTVVGMQLDLVRQDYATGNPEIAARTAEVQQLLEQAIDQVRRLSYELDTNLVQRSGLRYSLDVLVGRLRDSSPATIRCLMDTRVQLPPAVAGAVYQVAEQALQNAVRHSQATLIEAVLQPVQDGVRLEVRDNGVGFNVEETLAQQKGLGLPWMFHRAARAGLECTLESVPGQGTVLEALYRHPGGTTGRVDEAACSEKGK
ncbi:MAG: hypothetical protein HY235_16690 [Acidobacteria bacterium]|nr:hypothetical protein [Acidobacteriota bacterium]